MRAVLIGLAVVGWAGVSFASETITYTYDAHGRLITASHSGTVNNGVQSSYSHDKADNRTNKTVTGASH